MDEDWETGLGYKLALCVVIVTVLISLLDLVHAPIFARETASTKAQVLGQDVVNIVLGVPATLYMLHLSRRGSLKARTALIGLMAYFAYTFLSYNILFKLNEGFLLYTAAFGLSLYATLINVAGLDVKSLHITASPSTKKWTPVIMAFILLIVVVLWTPDIAYFYSTGETPVRMTVDGVHTLAIHFQDLSIVVPLALLTAWLVRRDDNMGYMLAPVVLVKALSIALAVLGMIIVMHFSGTPAAVGDILVFVIGSLVIGGYTFRFYKGIEMTVG